MGTHGSSFPLCLPGSCNYGSWKIDLCLFPLIPVHGIYINLPSLFSILLLQSASTTTHGESCSDLLLGLSRRAFICAKPIFFIPCLSVPQFLYYYIAALLNSLVSMTSSSHLISVIILLARFCFSVHTYHTLLVWENEACT